MNIFQNFNNLWHNDNLLYDFLKNVWNFNDFLYCAVDWDDLFFVSINNLKSRFDLVSNVSLQDEVIFFYDFISIDSNFLNFGGILFNCDDLFLDGYDFDDLLLDDWDLYGFFFN